MKSKTQNLFDLDRPDAYHLDEEQDQDDNYGDYYNLDFRQPRPI
jgi:hypothetical protein